MTERRGQAKAYMVADFEIKAKDDTKRTFEGSLAASHLDYGKDIVWSGSFKRTLDQFKSAKNGYIPLVDSHNYSSVLNVFGHMLDAEEKLTGETLRYTKKDGGTLEVPEMLLNTEWQMIDGPDGDRILDRLRPSSVRKMSMGYVTWKDEPVELKTVGRARILREVALREGSLVVFPMQDNADINTASVKGLFDALRDGTLTEEQEAEIKTLPLDLKERFRALLEDPAPPVEGTPEAKGLAPEQMDALDQRILALKLRRLTSRDRGSVLVGM
jgi:HK97 family phage prohead protease